MLCCSSALLQNSMATHASTVFLCSTVLELVSEAGSLFAVISCHRRDGVSESKRYLVQDEARGDGAGAESRHVV